MRFILRMVFALSLFVATITVYTTTMAPTGSGEAPEMRPLSERADRVVVYKQDHLLELWRGDTRLAGYDIALGGAPFGHKQHEGDERTPEGDYVIDWRHENSVAYLSLHISYPNAKDIAHAHDLGIDPGGNIMIHGLLNGWGWLGGLHSFFDWTNGCIAVRNSEMRDIWARVANGTPITIFP